MHQENIEKVLSISATVERKQAHVRKMESSFLFYINTPFSEKMTVKLRPVLDRQETNALYAAYRGRYENNLRKVYPYVSPQGCLAPHLDFLTEVKALPPSLSITCLNFSASLNTPLILTQAWLF